MLAMKLITAQGIEVKALNINIGFGSTSDKSEIMKKRAAMVGADFEMIDVRNSYLQKCFLIHNTAMENTSIPV